MSGCFQACYNGFTCKIQTHGYFTLSVCFGHLFPSKSRYLYISFMHPWGLSYSFHHVSTFSLKEYTCGKWHFPKMAKAIYLVPHALLKLCHSLLFPPFEIGHKDIVGDCDFWGQVIKGHARSVDSQHWPPRTQPRLQEEATGRSSGPSPSKGLSP